MEELSPIFAAVVAPGRPTDGPPENLDQDILCLIEAGMVSDQKWGKNPNLALHGDGSGGKQFLEVPGRCQCVYWKISHVNIQLHPLSPDSCLLVRPSLPSLIPPPKLQDEVKKVAVLHKQNQELEAERTKLKLENEGVQGELKEALGRATKLTMELEVRRGPVATVDFCVALRCVALHSTFTLTPLLPPRSYTPRTPL